MLPYDTEAHRTVVVRDIGAATGRGADAWRELVSRGAPSDGAALRRWLMERFGLRWSQASAVAAELTGRRGLGTEPPLALVDHVYSGQYEGLRPIYEHIVAAASGLGPDVAIDATLQDVYLVRREDFGIVRPGASKHIDLGLALGDARHVPDRFEPGAMDDVSPRITHRLSVQANNEVDRQVLHWMRVAYEGAG